MEKKDDDLKGDMENNKEMKKEEFKYRADIDGMRGLCIISVILFHISMELLPGGFCGV